MPRRVAQSDLVAPRHRRRNLFGQAIALVDVEDAKALEKRDSAWLLAGFRGAPTFVVRREAIGIDDGCSPFALPDVAAKPERLAKGEPALSGEAALDNGAPQDQHVDPGISALRGSVARHRQRRLDCRRSPWLHPGDTPRLQLGDDLVSDFGVKARAVVVACKPGTVDLKFLQRVAKLSWSAEGPRLAVEFLAKHGIAVVCLEHLPRTHLDGAALQLADGTPVIGLTLRYDRLDNFWFCLLHELAHIGRHMGGTKHEAFIDDLSLRDVEGVRRDPKEDEADEWTENGLIPATVWQTSRVKDNPSPLVVMELAQRLEIHPAIVAGRVRHETRNFRLLSHFVGTGEVRRQLLTEGAGRT
jgi:hypothetical protein